MGGFRQIFSIAALNVRSLRSRLWTSMVIVAGMACVVGVLLSMLSFSAGLRRSIEGAGDPGRAIVVFKAARDEYNRNITRGNVVTVSDAPGIAKDTDGKPIPSAEHITNIPVKRKSDKVRSFILLRGVGPKGFLLRPGFHLVSGRMFHPGTHEVIVGVSAQSQFEGLNVGDSVRLLDGPWKIVGSFTTGGDMIESELLGEIETVLAGVNRNGYGSIIVQTEPGAFDQFKTAVTTNPTLNVDVYRQSDFYAASAGQFTTFLATIAYVMGGMMAVGALFGTINIMYSAVAARTREIATLRAIGFGGVPVAFSVVAEALFLAVAGCLIGAFVAWALFSGNQDALGANVFRLAVTPGLVAIGLSWAVVIALLGGLFPAIRAARLPVATALRRG